MIRESKILLGTHIEQHDVLCCKHDNSSMFVYLV